MEDDIDIEEHDVLDNPRIRTMFPELTQIKQEIPDHDPDQELNDPPYPEDDDAHQETEAELSRFENKIILGSKPAHAKVANKIQIEDTIPIFGRKSIEIKQEMQDYEDTDQNEHEEYHPSTVMILGSKPSNTGVIEPIRVSEVEDVIAKSNNFDQNIVSHDTTDYTDHKDPTTAFVLAEDWGPRLDNSPCFCKDCEILFPTRNTLLAHNMTAHSFLVAVDVNKAKKSTAKVNDNNIDGKWCNHCNRMFPDSDSLINHLYEKLTFDKNNAAFKSQPKNVVAKPVQPKKIVANPLSINVVPTPNVSANDDVFGLHMFRCEICTFYCQIYGFFIKHMQSNHGINTASTERVLFTGVCLYCNARIKNKTIYNKHLKLVHFDVYNSKGPFPKPQKLTPKKQEAGSSKQLNLLPVNAVQALPVKNYTFQCQKCSEFLPNYPQARRHRLKKHPEAASLNIFKKITHFNNRTVCVQKARVPAKVVLKYPIKQQKLVAQAVPSTSTTTKTSKSAVAVPKSTLFKCNKCTLHYTSCTATVLHAKTCSDQEGEWRCDVCDREFQDFDRIVHKRQHQVTKKFNVITYADNIYGKVLNKCPKCNVYFHEKDFFVHEQKNVCKGSGVKCEHCAYPIHPSSAETHSKWHDRIKFSKKDVIVVEFANLVIDEKTVLPAKRPLVSPNVTPIKKARIEDFNPQIKVNYCHNCGLFMLKPRFLENHVNGTCKKDPVSANFKICKVCGLTSKDNKNHARYHRVNPKVTFMDMKFVALDGRKPILPPIPDFPQCDNCQVHFGKQGTVNTHNCEDSYKTCEYCQKRFSDMAYKLHVRFHEYHTKFRQATQTLTNLAAKKAKLNAPLLPELLQKYEQLTNTWNILFSCVTCDIVCDSYDKAVEHCQKHLNNLESYDVIIEHCDICDLNFDGSSFEKHAELHAQNKSVVKASFTICSYRYDNLFTPMWMKQFRNIPKTQMDQILSRSVYRYGRSVKLRVEKEGPLEYIIYRCARCDMYVHPASLTNHYKNVTCSKDPKHQYYRCAVCEIQFSSIAGKLHHKEMHKRTDTFTVVYFNEEEDDEFNETLRKNDTSKRNALGPTMSGVGKAYHYYRCVLCKVCIGEKDKALGHKCNLKWVRRCHICHLNFHRTLLNRHIKLHELNPRFLRKNIKCTPFKINKTGKFEIIREDVEPDKSLVKLYKCQCGLHFTSVKAVDRHSDVCGTDTDIAKENCSKCDHLFDTSQLVTHLCKHHSQDDEKSEFEVINVTPNKASKGTSQASNKAACGRIFLEKNTSADVRRKSLYTCKKCNIYYLSPSGLCYHFETNHQLSKVQSCPHCKLKFMPVTLKKHIKCHHQNLKCSPKDFIIHIGTMQKEGHVKFVLQDENSSESHVNQVNKSKYTHKSYFDNLDMSRYSNALFKCEICNAYFLTYAGYSSHIGPKDKPHLQVDPKNHESILINCPECNYGFRERSLIIHRYIHHRRMNLKRKDFTINRYTAGGKVSREKVVDNQSLEDITEAKKDDIKLSKVRKSLCDADISRYSKTLYKCVVCNACFMTYKAYASHIQRENIDPTNHICDLNSCPDCGYGFREKSFFIHRIIHHEKMNLSRKDININPLTPRPKMSDERDKDSISQCTDDTAEEENEFEQSNTSETQLDVDESEHKTKPRKRYMCREMDMSKYSETLFKCEVCSAHFLTFKSYRSHISRENNDPLKHESVLQTCPDCGYTFCIKSLHIHHIVHHEKMNLKHEDFKINRLMPKTNTSKDSVTDSQCSEDSEVENISSVNDTTSQKSVDMSNAVAIGETDKLVTSFDEADSVKAYKYSNVLFKCGFCDWTSFRENIDSHIKSHPEGNPVPPVACFCGLQFGRNNLVKHEMLHHDKENLNREDLYVITLSLHEDHLGTEHIFKCGVCHVYFTKLSALENHFTYVGHNTPSRECSECGLAFQRQALPMHIKIHHDIMKLERKDFVLMESVGRTKVKVVELGEDLRNKDDRIGTDTDNDTRAIMKPPPKYKASLHKCCSCGIHFLTAFNLALHLKSCSCETDLHVTCEECQLQFSKHNVIQHKEKHHKYMRLQVEDFEIIQVDPKKVDTNDKGTTEPKVAESSIRTSTETDANVIAIKEEETEPENCQMQIDLVLSEASEDTALIGNDVDTNEAILGDIKMDLDDGSESIDYNMISDKDTAIVSTEISDSLGEHSKIEPKKSSDIESTLNASAKKDADDVIKLYKCAVCNVCFLSQVSCYKHATKHVTLDTKDYIECKLCGYQFLILNNCLHKHITKHHKKAFKPEDVLIEEYHPNILCHGTPKIDIYFGTDKVQSKLISTTCEASVSSTVTSTDLQAPLEDTNIIEMNDISIENESMDESVLGL
ncbi:hypothetical protein O0L34_g16022 [Tuta absoluta]|nr:hypothetical protein O0L34_g16022 [Tuta absoluta]